MRLAILVVVFLSFTVFSLFVTVSDGFSGLLGVVMREKWGLQMLLDLAIALMVAWTWLRHDAKARGITAWPYQLATLPLGSIAVLAYLVHRELAAKKVPVAATA